jgi:hypothetical protein
MLSPAQFYPGPSLAYREYGPAAVDGASARTARDGSQNQGAAGARRLANGAAIQQAGAIRIAGQLPSLSTEVIGALGQFDSDGRYGIDPLTNESFAPPPPQPPPDGVLDADSELGSPIRGGAPGPGSDELTVQDEVEIQRLQTLEVQARQQAAEAGVGDTVVMQYEVGPDGRLYAVAVRVNASLGNLASTNAVSEGTAAAPGSLDPAVAGLFQQAAAAYAATRAL